MANRYFNGGDYQAGQSFNKGGRGDDAAKIFVGGLSWETTVEELKAYFQKYGGVTDCTIKTDPNTGRSRGFGFVSFSDASCVDKVVGQSSHMLQGKKIDPKRAQARAGPAPIKKVFVGGLDPNIAESDIREYFGQFGTIEELNLPFDREKNMRKSFAFIAFDTEEAVEQLCADPKHTICGKEVEVKKATPKTDQGAGGFGGRGGGRGGMPRGGGPMRGAYGGGGYGGGGWDQSAGGYGAAPAYGGGAAGGGYDYNSYYVQQQPQPAAYGGYDASYGQQYGSTAGAYDYSSWYGTGQQAAPAAAPAATNGGGYMRGGGQRGTGTGDARYQPYSR